MTPIMIFERIFTSSYKNINKNKKTTKIFLKKRSHLKIKQNRKITFVVILSYKEQIKYINR